MNYVLLVKVKHLAYIIMVCFAITIAYRYKIRTNHENLVDVENDDVSKDYEELHQLNKNIAGKLAIPDYMYIHLYSHKYQYSWQNLWEPRLQECAARRILIL